MHNGARQSYSSVWEDAKFCGSKFRPALAALLDAFEYALDTNSDRWDFSVAMRQFEILGLSETDMRWLVRKGYVEHRREVTIRGDNGRQFRSTGDLTFSKKTCFVLTDAGVSRARSVIYDQSVADSEIASAEGNGRVVSNSLPDWDPEIRTLHVDDQVVKRFKWRAANQEAILSAFQEEGWPSRIDDPLPPDPEQDPKRRLSDTIKGLNHKQTNELIRFHGDGTGEGVTWERVGANGAANTTE